MAEGEADWELCKENIQPLKRGRDIAALHQALSQQDGSSYAAIQQQKQAFESEIRMYNGEDPLDVWDRYIKWTQQTYPQGGKESNLAMLLERAVTRFVDEKGYHNDARYVHLWIQFAENNSEPLDIYTYMQAQGIGTQQAAFYIAWSEEFEKHGNSKKSDGIYQEGLKCGAEPRDKLQQYHRAFQARVSRQLMSGMKGAGEEEDEDEDSPEPVRSQRESLVDLKHRGKKKVIAPINRTGASVSHRSGGLNLQLPSAPHNRRVEVFDENHGAVGEEFEPRVEPWLAPPTSRAKENELVPEKWTKVKMPQKSRFGHTVLPTPSKPNFQPYVEESDQPPAMTPCKINPTVNTVLSARKPSKEETPLERLQEQQQQQQQQQVEGQPKEQSMYCKELLFSGVQEFCFEELRAERHRKKSAQQLEDKEADLRRVKQELMQQIEEKQKLLQQRSTETGARLQTGDAPLPVSECPPVTRGSGAGFKVYDESQANSTTGTCLPSENDVKGSAIKDLRPGKLQSTALPFAIFDESCTDEEQPSGWFGQPPPRLPVCRPLTAILKPLGRVPATRPESDALEGIEPLNEDAIVGGYCNKTVYPGPDDTCDFARAAHLASTPFSGGLSQRARPGSDGDLADLSDLPAVPAVSAADYEAALRVKLSPIQEASLEDGHHSSTSSTSSLSGSSTAKATPSPLVLAEIEQEDPYSAKERLRVLEKIDLGAFPELRREPGPLPAIAEEDVLFPGEEAVLILSTISSRESCTVHFGETKSTENVVVKVDFEPIPWDFYIGAQLRTRLGSDSVKYFSDQSVCFLYDDGCVTLIWGRYQSSLQDYLSRSTLQPEVAAFLAVELLEMVEQMHLCHLVHGDIRPDTLLLKHSQGPRGSDNVLKMMGFSRCLDLDMQPEVTSVQDLSTARGLLQLGVLSPSSSPYQVDLLGVADTVHAMLGKGNMQLVKDCSGWRPAEMDQWETTGSFDVSVWHDFFSKILNPEGRSTVSVLKELQQLMRNHSNHGAEDKLVFINDH